MVIQSVHRDGAYQQVLRLIDRAVMQHLERYALVVAVICLLAIGLLH